MYIGNERIQVGGHDIDLTLDDFWRWSFSDFSDFSTRAAFSRFLTASSLGLTVSDIARDKHTNDLLWSQSGTSILKVGVRTAAYIQSDEAEHPDHIVFDIPTEHTCNAYVFCVFKALRQTESPLNTDLWDFYSLKTIAFNGSNPYQQFITLPALMEFQPVWSDYYGIGAAIQKAMTAR